MSMGYLLNETYVCMRSLKSELAKLTVFSYRPPPEPFAESKSHSAQSTQPTGSEGNAALLNFPITHHPGGAGGAVHLEGSSQGPRCDMYKNLLKV